MRGEFILRHPFASRAIERLRFAARQAAKKKSQVNRLLRIRVGDALKQFANLHVHTKFLTQFADEALLGSFVWLAFATGKFPQPAEMRSCVTLRDEKFSGTEDQTGADFD